jgi:hypothetical protein
MDIHKNVRILRALVPYKMKSMFHELKCDLKEATTNGTIDPIALASAIAINKWMDIHKNVRILRGQGDRVDCPICRSFFHLLMAMAECAV